ncbi:MAG: polysaccharide pyruvyl transferase family protein [Chthoniobacterales bacterium]|nr:polysaccharide pyruvyl transferase family protein [Chthoniobacterales bacterium]MCX7712913.1 polysaccharide pyruvyl transferase family protein [Chthoniobacterales bacterium]
MAKKVAIITYHHVVNYGAVLQAYALNRFLRKVGGFSVETIDYRPPKAIEAYNKALFENNPLEKNNRARAEKIEFFVRNYIPLTDKSFSSQDQLLEIGSFVYDSFITGSDEVWNIHGFRGFDTSYFLGFVQFGHRYSYAASFGFTESTGQYRAQISSLLEKFDAISVRDNHSLHIIQEELGLRCVKVLDPTLLLKNYDEIIQIPPERGFIFVYSNCSPEEADYIRRFAKYLNKPIIAAAYPLEGAENRLELSPGEWLGHFAAADYVFNGFFHGVAMSLFFQKPFTAFAKPDKIKKVGDLLADVGLADRIVTDPSPNSSLPSPDVDFKNAILTLERLNEESRAFLLENL